MNFKFSFLILSFSMTFGIPSYSLTSEWYSLNAKDVIGHYGVFVAQNPKHLGDGTGSVIATTNDQKFYALLRNNDMDLTVPERAKVIELNDELKILREWNLSFPDNVDIANWFYSEGNIYILSHNFCSFYGCPDSMRSFISRLDLLNGELVHSKNLGNLNKSLFVNLSPQTLLVADTWGGPDKSWFRVIHKSNLRPIQTMNYEKMTQLYIGVGNSYFVACQNQNYEFYTQLGKLYKKIRLEDLGFESDPIGRKIYEDFSILEDNSILMNIKRTKGNSLDPNETNFIWLRLDENAKILAQSKPTNQTINSVRFIRNQLLMSGTEFMATATGFSNTFNRWVSSLDFLQKSPLNLTTDLQYADHFFRGQALPLFGDTLALEHSTPTAPFRFDLLNIYTKQKLTFTSPGLAYGVVLMSEDRPLVFTEDQMFLLNHQ